MRQVLRPGALGRPGGIGWRGRWEGGSGWGIHVYPRLIKKKKKEVERDPCAQVKQIVSSEKKEKKRKEIDAS